MVQRARGRPARRARRRGDRLPHRDRARDRPPVRGVASATRGPAAPTSGSRPARTTSASRLDDMADGRHGSSGTRRAAAASRSSGSGSCSRDGHVHTIGSDHAPLAEASPAPTSGRSSRAPATASSRCCPSSPPRPRGGASRCAQVVGLLSTTPARLFGLFPRKGTIAVGADADFCRASRRTAAGRSTRSELEYHEQEKWSPFDGREVTVYPVYTVLRGRVIFAEGEVTGEPGHGELIANARRCRRAARLSAADAEGGTSACSSSPPRSSPGAGSPTGVPLSHPEAVALASDTVLERARRGATYEDARATVHGLFQPRPAPAGRCRAARGAAPGRGRRSATAAGSCRSSGWSPHEAGRGDPRRRAAPERAGDASRHGSGSGTRVVSPPTSARTSRSRGRARRSSSTATLSRARAPISRPGLRVRIDPGAEIELPVVWT